MRIGPVIREYVSLLGLNTMAVNGHTRYLAELTRPEHLLPVLEWASERELETLVLGGGSNLIFTGDYPGLILHMKLRGRSWEQVQGNEAILVLKAGENWHESVLYAARSGYRGVENLALIPGTAGAAPVQNIGAYGVELSDCLVGVTALNRQSRKIEFLSSDTCRFSYRDSLFKQQPDRYIILELRLRLSRSAPLRLGYRDLQDYFSGSDIENLTPLDVAEAVMAVRHRKLPDPSVLPNSGSFFKNPVVSTGEAEELRRRFPDLVSYPSDHGEKLAAAWLIDQAGWKGFRNQKVGIHHRQALVLINHSGGSGQDVLALAGEVRHSVQNLFGIKLEMEPGVIGAT